MRKTLFLTMLSLLVFSQPISSPLGLNFLEMGWRYSDWNPAALNATVFNGPVFSFSYLTDMETLEFSNLEMGYQAVEGELAGELKFTRKAYQGKNRFSLVYTVAGVNGDYYWGGSAGIYYTSDWESTVTSYGIKIGFGFVGGMRDFKIAMALNDVILYSSNPAELATGKLGMSLGWVGENFALHFGAITSSFRVFDMYTGLAVGIAPAFAGVSFGYTTDLNRWTYHFGSGMMWQGEGIFLGVRFDVSQNPIPFGDVPPLPYRFSVFVKLPIGGE